MKDLVLRLVERLKTLYHTDSSAKELASVWADALSDASASDLKRGYLNCIQTHKGYFPLPSEFRAYAELNTMKRDSISQTSQPRLRLVYSKARQLEFERSQKQMEKEGEKEEEEIQKNWRRVQKLAEEKKGSSSEKPRNPSPLTQEESKEYLDMLLKVLKKGQKQPIPDYIYDELHQVESYQNG